ncbi:MAG: biotin transporter BioY [Chlamydiales bacterium]
MLNATFTQRLQSLSAHRSFSLVFPLVGSLFLALMSQLAVYLPYSPIPITMQTLALFLMAGTMGSRHATNSVVVYLFEGTCGLPVFAGAAANPLWMMSPKAGFLIGFVFAVWIIGKLLEKQSEWKLLTLLSVLVFGQLAIYAIGAVWLSLFIGFSKAVLFGVLPFLTGAALKIGAAAAILKGFHSLVKNS